MSRYWRCRRVRKGIQCGQLNLRRKQKCTACGGPRPKPRVPAHRKVLLTCDYETFERMFGSRCGICGAVASERRRLDRDHDHKTGMPRGLLCARCNRALPSWITEDWLRRAADYLAAARAVEWPTTEEAA